MQSNDLTCIWSIKIQ